MEGKTCQNCLQNLENQLRYQCISCIEDYCLCSTCISMNDQSKFHSPDHIFLRVPVGSNININDEKKKLKLINENETDEITLDILGLTVEQIKDMLRRENELRLSENTMARFKVEGHQMYVPITEEIQLQVCKEFGLSDEVGLTALRCADRLMPTPQDLAEIKEISFYRKYNRMKDGNVNVGDRIPSICFHYPFYTLDSQLISFKDILSFPSSYSWENQPIQNSFSEDIINIVFASSIT